MIFKNSLLCLFTLIMTQTAYAQDPAAPVVQDDPYACTELFSRGPNEGQVIPTAVRRSIKIISRDLINDAITVANVLHDKTFHIATIPLSGVEKLIFQLDYFNSTVPAAHTEMRIKFKDNSPVILHPQLLSKSHEAPIAIHELVFSIEAIKDESSVINFFKGFVGYYAVAYRLMSIQDKRHDLVDVDKEKVAQYKIRASKKERRRFLINALQVSDQKQNTDIYNTWTNNCTTELIRLLDNTMDVSWWRRFLKNFTTLGAHYPVWVRSALRARGLLGKQLPDFKDDPSVNVKETPVESLDFH